MQKGKGGYIMIPIALLFALDISQEEKVKKLLDHGKPVLLTELGDGKNDVFVMPQETEDGVLLENVYGYDILVGEEETTSEKHSPSGYQTINISLDEDGESNYFVEESEGKEELKHLLKNIGSGPFKPIKKPLLFQIDNTVDSEMFVGFGFQSNGAFYVKGDNSYYFEYDSGNDDIRVVVS